MKLALTNFSLKRPWLVIGLLVAMTGMFLVQFPKVKFDNDPENMLSEDEYIRVFHNSVKAKYNLYDFVIVGIVNEDNPNGIFNVDTLKNIHELTSELISLRQGADGLPTVTRRLPNGSTEPSAFDLRSESAWQRILANAFRHDPNHLFDDEGNSAIISREIISPSVVDNIKQSGIGSLKMEYLMEQPPATQEEALVIRSDAMGNPLYSGTLVSEDEKAICIYIPITSKNYSYNVALLVGKLTEGWKGSDKVFITGQPVAQDTFGVEMLVQMATSAPLAGLAIFLLMWFFFKRVSLIIAPMLVAIVSVVCTMGLLIGLGFNVHIMSSMIAIFLMPIAVADSVHILSEFFDAYHKFNDKAKTVRYVIGHLFMPMLYTSLTTIAGFASLGTTPIPPVKVFGLHVAFGVALAWVLTMTLIPAYIMIAVPVRSLQVIGKKESAATQKQSRLNGFLEWLGSFTYLRWKMILVVTVGIVVISVIGISQINVNDNPVKWFTKKHSIRVADDVLNQHFGGTYTAYLTLSSKSPDAYSCSDKAAVMRREAEKRFLAMMPDATSEFLKKLDDLALMNKNVGGNDVRKCFVKLVKDAELIDANASQSWNNLADKVNYLDADGLTFDSLSAAVNTATDVKDVDKQSLLRRLVDKQNLAGSELQDAALTVCDEFTALSFAEFVYEMEAELTAPLFKNPEMLRYIELLQARLVANDVVGKTSSLVDALKKASYELNYATPASDATDGEVLEYKKRNESYRNVAGTVSAVAQVFTQLEGMKKKDALFHLVTKDYQEVNLWVQLKSGDNVDMESVVDDIDRFVVDNPPPVELNLGWAGLTYLNVVWQDKMVRGMMSSLISSFVVVLVMMIILFRSPLWGMLAMIPLSVTIAFIYGLIGLVGKDYDMPVAILSALTLGLSVDFAIHFLERAREEQKKLGSWKEASKQMFKEPAMAISRNAITISVGFTPLLLAPLVPYKTVGFFLATIMAVSWMATLFILPALLSMFRKRLFGEK